MQTLTYPARRRAIPDAVLGMLFLVAAEVMFFSGLISAYIINRSGVEQWPPLNQPRLPVFVTGINTLVLLLSGVFMWLFVQSREKAPQRAKKRLIISIVLGATFLLVQGTEWSNMLAAGMHSQSSVFSAFFYTIIGAHGMHVFAGLLLLLYAYRLSLRTPNAETGEKLQAFGIYWYFVVAVWPILYALVYFN
jgi:heme/copper-type cytochrome/quinol oxidase subunit 3